MTTRLWRRHRHQANALRAIAPHLAGSRLLQIAAVRGGRTYRRRGPRGRLREVIASGAMPAPCAISGWPGVKSKQLKKACTLLYLAGADLARDSPANLARKGFTVVTHTTYRMVAAPSLPRKDL